MSSGLADVLIGAGLLSPEEAHAALAYRGRQGGTLPQAVVELGFCDPNRLARTLSETLRVALVPPSDLSKVTDSLASIIPAGMATDYRAVPVNLGGDRLLLALSDPTDRRAMEEVAFFTGLTVVPAACSEADLAAALYRFYQHGSPPPDSGPMAVSWSAASDAPSVEAEGTPTLGPPVELAVRVRETSHAHSGAVEAEEMAEPIAPADAPTPVSGGARVASPATPEVQTQYSSLSWWLGQEQQPTVQVRSPKNVDAPAAHQPRISHDQVLGRMPSDPTLELMLAPEPVGPKPRPTQRMGSMRMARPAAAPADQDGRPTTLRLGRTAPPPPWQGDPMLAELAGASDRRQVLSLALPYLLQSWARAAMFVVREGMVFGLDGTGEGLETRLLRGMMIPLNAPSVFKAAFDSSEIFVGPPPAGTINQMCFKVLGGEPRLLAVLPISLPGSAVVALFYADSGSSGKGDPGDPRLELLRAAASRALENILLHAKGGR